MAKETTDASENMTDELEAVIAGMQQADTDVDAFPAWEFDKLPILKGKVTKIKSVDVVRRGNHDTVRIAIVEVGSESFILWESSNLGGFFDSIEPGVNIVVVFKGMEELGGGRRMRTFDAYYK